MNREEIIELIPHREPFLLVDEVLELDERRVVGSKVFQGDEWFFAGHYPGRPLTPGVLLCEAALQCGAILLAHLRRSGDSTPRLPLVTRMDNVRFKRMVRPGEKILVEVELCDRLTEAYFLKAKITVEGQLAVRLDFAAILSSSAAAEG